MIFSIDKSKMIGVPIPGPVNRIIQREVNPVYDLDAFAERSRKDIQRARDLLDYEFYLEVDKIKVDVVGDEPYDKTPSGLWPSDHAGVAADISFEK